MGRSLSGLALSGVLAMAPSAASAQELLDVATNGHRQTWEQITSIYTDLTVESRQKKELVSTSHFQWWQQGEKVRSREISKGLALDMDDRKTRRKATTREEELGIGARTTIVRHRSREGLDDARQATIDARPVADVTHSLGMWSMACFTLSDWPPVWVKDALRSTDWRLSAERATLVNKPMIFIQGQRIKTPMPSFQIWIDPEHNYLVKKAIVYDYDGDFDPARRHSVFEIRRFHPPDKNTGIHFPAEVLRHFFLNNKDGSPGLELLERVDFTAVTINGPIAADVFQLTIPVGYQVIDRAAGKHYTMGANGQEIAAGPILPIPPPPAPRQSWTWVWLFVAGAALSLAGIIAWRRRVSAS